MKNCSLYLPSAGYFLSLNWLKGIATSVACYPFHFDSFKHHQYSCNPCNSPVIKITAGIMIASFILSTMFTALLVHGSKTVGFYLCLQSSPLRVGSEIFLKKFKSMVFDHTPPNLNYNLLIQNFFRIFFLSLFWVTYH